MKCSNCKKDKDESYFTKGDKTYKTCQLCRDQAKKWREDNKERQKLYNKTYNAKKTKDRVEKTGKTFVYAQKVGTDEWTKFESQAAAAAALGVHKSNVNKVIKGSLSTTGGYIFKVEKEEVELDDVLSWEDVKKKHDIEENVKGKPSGHRVLHEIVDDIIGKKCCSCKEWKPLTEYNNMKSHWDNLRNDCKKCLVKYRRKNVKKISKNYIKYETERKKVDPEFKLLKTLRTRIGCAIKSQNGHKYKKTEELVGCPVSELKNI